MPCGVETTVMATAKGTKIPTEVETRGQVHIASKKNPIYILVISYRKSAERLTGNPKLECTIGGSIS
jgi:hypothetical protein